MGVLFWSQSCNFNIKVDIAKDNVLIICPYVEKNTHWKTPQLSLLDPHFLL